MLTLPQQSKLFQSTIARTLSLILATSFLMQLGLAATNPIAHETTTSKSVVPKTEVMATSATSESMKHTLSSLPISFEINRGQVDSRIKFLSRGNGYSLSLTSTESILSLSRPSRERTTRKALIRESAEQTGTAVIRMTLAGANSNPRVEGLDQLPGKVNYFRGNDPKKWRTELPSYARVKYYQVYPGIDLVYYGSGQQLEYDFVVAPGANPNDIRMGFNGAEKIEVDARGDLVLHSAAGDLHHRKPQIYQETNGVRQEVSGRFVSRGKRQVSFEVGDYDRTKPLMIDPVIAYSTLLGGSGAAWANGIATYTAPDGKVYVYVVGVTNEADFPVKSAVQPTFAGIGPSPWEGDVFVAKLDMTASGDTSLIYSTYLGGSGNESGAGVAVDAAGNTYVTGSTGSTDFPILKAAQSSFGGGLFANGGYATGDAFVTCLSSDGASLIYSTYLGGSKGDQATGIAVDSAGNAYVTGKAFSANFPVVNAYQSAPVFQGAGASATFVAKIAPPVGFNPASVAYSTYLGGSSIDGDIGTSIAVDSGSNVYVTGMTQSPLFPIVNGFQATLRCSLGNAFMTKLNPSAVGAASLLYSTYLGGGPCDFGGDAGLGIAADSSGSAYVTGTTTSNDFPTTPGAFMRNRRTMTTGFVAKIDTTSSGASSLIYSTLLGGFSSNGPEGAKSIAIDASGNAYVTGETNSFDFPLVNSVQTFNSGVFQSIDDGGSWTGIHNGLTIPRVTAMVIDTSTSPRTLYAGGADAHNEGLGINVSGGVFKTVDGGLNWSAMNNGLTNTDVRALVSSPTNPSTIYAATGGGVFKTTDGGTSWSALNAGLSALALTSMSALAFDPRTTPPTLYAGVQDDVYKISEGGSIWTSTSLTSGARSIIVDSRTSPSEIYAVGFSDDYGYRSSNGGTNWTAIQTASEDFYLVGSIAVDPQTGTLYRGASWSDTIYKSVDKGDSWEPFIDLSGSFGSTMTIDGTTTPSTLYVRGNGLQRSTDGGNTWTQLFDVHIGVGALAVDTTAATSATPPVIYVGTGGDSDAFISKLDSTGSSLLFSTCLGGYGSEYGSGVAIDTSGNIYVAGKTGGPFPTVNAYQATGGAFIVKLGNAVLPSVSASSVTTQVVVQSGTLELSFPNITGSSSGSAPTVTVDSLDSTAAANLTLSNNLGAYDIKTTATYDTSGYATDPTKGIKLAFSVPTVNDSSVFNSLVITHGEDQNGDGIIQPNEMIPYNGTVDPNKTTYHDFSSRTVWVYVPSLSPFVIVKGAADQFNDLIRLIKSFNLKTGIENSLDAKLQNALKAYQATLAKDRATACNKTAAFVSEVQAQTGKAVTQAQAAQLISTVNQIKVVLGCR